MNYLTAHLHQYLLQPVEFILNDKVIKRGKVKVFNFKQYFIKFTLETESGDLKVYDMMYPYRLDVDSKGNIVFNYHLSAFAGGDKELYAQMKELNKDSALPAYDGTITLKTT